MFCKRCGRELKEGANFCPGCGEALGAQLSGILPGPLPAPVLPPQVVSGPPRKRLRIFLVAGIIALVLIGGAVAGILVWQNHEKHTVGHLIKQLNSSQVAARVAAAKELETKGDPAAITPLIGSIQNDSDQSVQEAAAHAVAKIDGTDGVKALAGLLLNSNSRTIAAGALAQLENVDAINAIFPIVDSMATSDLQSIMPDVQSAMWETLSSQMEGSLIDHLSDASANIREFCRGILVETVSTEAWDALIEALRGPYVLEVQSAMASSTYPRTDLLITAIQDPAAGAPWALADILRHVANSTASQDATNAKNAVLAFIQAQNPTVIAANYSMLIGWGVSGSEGALIAALNAYGNVTMGEGFLNSGNQQLVDAATNWGTQHGYTVVHGSTPPGATAWGSN